MLKIYKYTCRGDSNTSVSFSTTNKDFKEEIKENEKKGFDVSEDTIETIKYKNIDELCDKLNYEWM